jgi:hypothetical protein
MRSNPFYALSASAMLLGCWLLSQALHLQAGQVHGLLVLMAVLQLYEGLLVALGAFLVRSGRAPGDGVTVLLLESVFLVDAPLLTVECVTASTSVGTAAAVLLAGLAVAKLAWVRRSAPLLLSPRAAALLAAQAVFVLAVPVAAAHLAAARFFGPHSLYALWWATLALPIAEQALRREAERAAGASRLLAAWTWVPAVLVFLHLWAVGFVHQVGFRPALLAPFLLGLALVARPEQGLRQAVLPALAVLVSLGQDASLGFRLLGSEAVLVSPLRLALVGAAAAWGYLAWRDRERVLAVLGTLSAVAALLGSSATAVSVSASRLVRFLGSLLPRDACGWGIFAVIGAFVLLAEGARHSLGIEPPRPRRRAPASPPAAGSVGS